MKKTFNQKLAEYADLKLSKDEDGNDEFVGTNKEFQIFNDLQNLDHDELKQCNFKF